MLTLSTQHTIDYWLQHVHPDHTLEIAQRMNALITELSNDIASIDIDAVPLGPERKQLPMRLGRLSLRARAAPQRSIREHGCKSHPPPCTLP